MYLSVVLNMYAVLIATLLLVVHLFYAGENGTQRMLSRFHIVAALPSVLLFAAQIFFFIGSVCVCSPGRGSEGFSRSGQLS